MLFSKKPRSTVDVLNVNTMTWRPGILSERKA